MNEPNQDQRSQLKALIALGKEQGYLTLPEINDYLSLSSVEPEQIDDIVTTWLETKFEGGRHLRRFKQIQAFERK